MSTFILSKWATIYQKVQFSWSVFFSFRAFADQLWAMNALLNAKTFFYFPFRENCLFISCQFSDEINFIQFWRLMCTRLCATFQTTYHGNLKKNRSKLKPLKVKKGQKVPKVGAPQSNTNIEYCAMENLGAKNQFMIWSRPLTPWALFHRFPFGLLVFRILCILPMYVGNKNLNKLSVKSSYFFNNFRYIRSIFVLNFSGPLGY
jgi:hypothetical protein